MRPSSRRWPRAFRPRRGAGSQALLSLYGDAAILDEARRVLPARAAIGTALDELQQLADHAAEARPDVKIGFDLADLSGYAYYSGARFAIYAEGASDAIARGGRYDEVGAIFGRTRPAVGFSLDVKEVAELVPQAARQAGDPRPGLGRRRACAARCGNCAASGEIVVCELPGDRERRGRLRLRPRAGPAPTGWMVQGGDA